MVRLAAATLITLTVLCACGGGGTSPSPIAPAPTAVPTSGSSSIIAGSSAQSATLQGTGAIGATTVTFPATTGASSVVTLAFSLSPPAGAPAVQANLRKLPSAIGGSLSPVAYIVVTPAATVSFASTPMFTFALAAGATLPSGANVYVGLYDPTETPLGWTTFLGPGATSGQSISFASAVQAITLQANVSYVFGLFSTA